MAQEAGNFGYRSRPNKVITQLSPPKLLASNLRKLVDVTGPTALHLAVVQLAKMQP